MHVVQGDITENRMFNLSQQLLRGSNGYIFKSGYKQTSLDRREVRETFAKLAIHFLSYFYFSNPFELFTCNLISGFV